MSKFLSLTLVLLTAIGVLALFVLVLPAQGTIPAAPLADIVVNTLEDEDNNDGDCALREAIRAANENIAVDACPAGDVITDTITFSVSSMIVLTDQLSVTAGGPLLIDGTQAITLSGGGSVRIFYVNTGAELTLESITLVYGYAGDDFSYVGGGIYNLGMLTVNDSLLSGNHADQSGGGIYMQAGSLVLNNSIITDSRTDWDRGGGIFNAAEAVVTITNSSVSENIGCENGGGISNQGNMTIIHSTLSGNRSIPNVYGACFDPIHEHTHHPDNYHLLAYSAGGGISNSGMLTILDSTLLNNVAVGDQSEGGGIDNRMAGSLNITGSTLSGNYAGWGGGFNNTGDLALTDSILSNNTAIAHSGGGILNYVTLTVTNSTLSNNIAQDRGGGIYNTGQLDIHNSTLSGNYATGDYDYRGSGGGIYNDNDLAITNSTLSGNFAAGVIEGHGGGIDNWGTLILSFSTLYGNSASLEGGGLHTEPGFGVSTLDNSIVAYSPSGGNCAGDPITDAGYNIEDTDTCDFDADTSMPNTDPLLGPLQDNGGPTWTHAFSPVSPAIDAADPTACPPTDQRGVPRPVDGDGDGTPVCDIGSFELDQWIILNPALQSKSAAPGDTLVYTINLTNHTNLTDTYSLTLGTHAWETALSTNTIGPLSSGASQPFTVSVSIPVTTTWYMTDTVVLTAASLTSPTLYWDTAQITTQAYAPPQISLSPQELTSMQDVDQVVTLPLTISNGLGVTLTFSISTSEVTPWLSVDPGSGIVGTNSSAQLQVILNATGVPPGVYAATLIVESNDPDTPSLLVPVTMTVQEEPTPGLLINGHVRLSDGSGLVGVSIYRSYAAYPGDLVATTDQDGFYQSDFAYIPGDEMVTVWAELDGYTFEPLYFYWRHYYGYEVRTLDFLATPGWHVFVPIVAGME